MSVVEIPDIEKRVIDYAREIHSLPEVCDLIDYHPDFGRVPEHWRVKPVIMYVINRAVSDERSS